MRVAAASSENPNKETVHINTYMLHCYNVTSFIGGKVIKINENTPDKLGNAFQDAGITWVWYDIERNLISSMFMGLAICFPISFLVLLFATRNCLGHANRIDIHSKKHPVTLEVFLLSLVEHCLCLPKASLLRRMMGCLLDWNTRQIRQKVP